MLLIYCQQENFLLIVRVSNFFVVSFGSTFSEIRRDPEHIYQQISKGVLGCQELNIGNLYFFDRMATLFEYLPADTLFVNYEHNQTQAERFYQDICKRYESYRVDPYATFT